MKSFTHFCFISLLSFFAAIASVNAATTLAKSTVDFGVQISRANVAYDYVTIDGGNGSSSTDELEAYIPIEGTTVSPQCVGGGCTATDFSALVNPINFIPIVSANTRTAFAASTAFVKTFFNIKNEAGQSLFLYVGFFNTIDNTIDIIENVLVENFTEFLDGETYDKIPITFNIENLCQQASCDLLIGTAVNDIKVSVVYFLSIDNNLNGPESNPPSGQTGNMMHFKMHFSNTVNSDITGAPRISEVKTGDASLNIVIADGDNHGFGNDLLKTVIINRNAAGADGLTIGEILANESLGRHDIVSPVEEGELTIRSLENNVTYSFSVAQVDKFHQATRSSNVVTGTPLEIDAFLQSQSCYLVSAGFQEEHFVLDYFRKFRDETLVHSDMGLDFVFWYYTTAPAYAHYIYDSEVLSFIVRSLSFLLYGIMNYGVIVLFMMIAVLFFYLFAKTIFVPQRINE
jgi:hypothetical protein